MSRPRGPDGQFLPKAWPLDKAGKPKREALAAKDPIAVAHRAEKPYSKEEKEKRRKVPPEESGQRDPISGQIQGGIPGHAGSFGRIPNDIRQELIDSAGEYIGVLREIAADEKATRTEKMKAVELCLRYGPGPVSQHDVHHSGLLGVVGVIERLPTESLKQLEAMNDEQLSQAFNFMLGDHSGAAEEFTRKIEALARAQEHEPTPEAPRKALPKPKAAPATERTVADAAIAGGRRPYTADEPAEEPPETVEAVVQKESDRKETDPAPRKESYFYSQNGTRVIPISQFGYVRKS